MGEGGGPSLRGGADGRRDCASKASLPLWAVSLRPTFHGAAGIEGCGMPPARNGDGRTRCGAFAGGS
jgi:hypothetical protein